MGRWLKDSREFHSALNERCEPEGLVNHSQTINFA